MSTRAPPFSWAPLLAGGVLLLLLIAALPAATPTPVIRGSSSPASSTAPLGPSSSVVGVLTVLVINDAPADLAGATVAVTGATPQTTPANGSVRFLLPAGVAEVDVYDPNYSTSHSNVTVQAGEVVPTEVELYSLPGTTTYSVLFEVYNASSGDPVVDAAVTFDHRYQGTTGALGELDGATTYRNGTYGLNVTATGFQTNDTEGTVAGPTTLVVLLTSNYTAPPPVVTLAGSYFPWDATLTIDAAVVAGTRHADGGAGFELNLSAGSHGWKLTYGAATVTGTFRLVAGTFGWVHFAGVNASTGNSSSRSGGSSGSDLLFLGVAVGAGAAVIVGVALAALLHRRSGKPPTEKAPTASEEISPKGDDGAHGHAGGDPPAETGARDPG